jgi:very-short-patch-repair endonuclease
MKDNMFYKASPLIFKKADELRNNLTEVENILWNYLKGNFDVKFRRQHPASIYVLHFYAHKIKLAIEVDGSIQSLEEVKKNDLRRQSHLESLGISFIRFSNSEVIKETDKVLKKNKI